MEILVVQPENYEDTKFINTTALNRRGHKTLRWNPKEKKIFLKKRSVHIIDLTQTLELTNKR